MTPHQHMRLIDILNQHEMIMAAKCLPTVKESAQNEAIAAIGKVFDLPLNWQEMSVLAGQRRKLLSFVKRFMLLPSGAWHDERLVTEEKILVQEAKEFICALDPAP